MAWLANWDYRASVVVASSKVPGDLTDFPVMVDLAEFGASHDFWSEVQSDGDDIRVTESDGTTEVPVDIVSIDTTGKTGIVHFLADGTLSSSSNTTFYLYYGNASAARPAVTDTYGARAVWGDYDGVWHLNESAGDFLDSAGTLEAPSSGNLPDQTTAPTGHGQDFDGTGDFAEESVADFSNHTTGSCSFWIKTGGSYYCACSSDMAVGNKFLAFMTIDNGIGIYTNVSGSITILRSTTQVDDDVWHLVHISAAVSTTSIWVDGQPETIVERNGTNNGTWFGNISGRDNIVMGALRRYGSSYYLTGLMAEFRVSTVQTTDDWAEAEFNNQDDPGTFVTLGTHEVVPSSGPPLTVISTN